MKDLRLGLVLVVSASVLASCADRTPALDDRETEGCDYASPKCNDDQTARLTCVNGVESVITCPCLDGYCQTTPSEKDPIADQTPGDGKCHYVTPKCNGGGTALLSCVQGIEYSLACTCANGACDKDELDVPKCSYTEPKCAGASTLLTCVNGVESSKTCPCSAGKCVTQEVVVTPKITSIQPSAGTVGTTVTISGSNLDSASTVCFASNCASPQSVTSDAVTVAAPEGTGDVMVTVELAGKKLSAGMFSYIQIVEEDVVDWCQLIYVEPAITPNDAVDARALVFEQGKTGASSQHEGIVAQIGYISDADGKADDILAWNWIGAERNRDFSDPAADLNDEYTTSIKLDEGTYRVAFRVSNDGSNWLYCDRDGSTNGFSMSQTGKFTVSETPEPVAPKVGWCRIVNEPTSISSTTGSVSEPIYAQAFVEGCTHYQTHCAQLKAQIGFGAKYLTSETELASGFQWSDAVINEAYDGGGGKFHDEFMGTVVSAAAGSFNVLYRMSVDGGKTWAYCDTTDDPVFTASDAVVWTVSPPEAPEDPAKPDPTTNAVEWCRLWSPTSIELREGQASELIFGRAFVDGCTGSSDGCAELTAQIGYGRATDDITALAFVDAAFNPSAYDVGNNDEFMAVIKPDSAGDYIYIYRFSTDGGATWTYCDAASVAPSNYDHAGRLTVAEDKDTIAWCRVQYPAHVFVETGNTTGKIYAQVLVTGCSEGSAKCDAVRAQLGYGDRSADPSTYVTYVDAVYNGAMISGNNDEYYATLAPDAAGDYALVYRFSTDDGSTWTYCDFDNDAGFKTENAASLTVTDPAPKVISWCQFFTSDFDNDTISTYEGTDSARIYAQAYIEGCTEPAGACSGLTAYIGYGKKGADPSTYTYTAGVDIAYVKNVGNNDEFSGSIHVAEPGDYGIAYAFSLDGATTMTYCGNTSASTYTNTATLSVKPHAVEGAKFVRGTDYVCGLADPSAIEATVDTPRLVFGQIYIPGCTQNDNQAACKNIVSSHLHFIESSKSASNALESSAWTTLDAVLNTAYTGSANDEFMAQVSFSSASTYHYAYSFDLKRDPDDEHEKAQRVYCYLNWDSEGYGSIVAN